MSNGRDCQVNDTIYKCDVTRPLPKNVILDLQRENGTAISIGTSYHLIKRYCNNRTTLSSYMWHLKRVSSETPNLKWSVLRCVPPYSNILKKCILFWYEKLKIVTYQNQKELLNKRSELLCKCHRANKFFLTNYISSDFR